MLRVEGDIIWTFFSSKQFLSTCNRFRISKKLKQFKLKEKNFEVSPYLARALVFETLVFFPTILNIAFNFQM